MFQAELREKYPSYFRCSLKLSICLAPCFLAGGILGMHFGLLPFLVKNRRTSRFQRIAGVFFVQSVTLGLIIFGAIFKIHISPRPGIAHLQEFSCEVSTDEILGF